MTPNPKPPRPIRDRKHLAFVASLPCCITGQDDGVQAHHLLSVSEKCMGRRSGDDKTIPLHFQTHTALHRHGDERGFLEGCGIDGPALAAALYEASGDYELACAILRGLQAAK